MRNMFLEVKSRWGVAGRLISRYVQNLCCLSLALDRTLLGLARDLCSGVRNMGCGALKQVCFKLRVADFAIPALPWCPTSPINTCSTQHNPPAVLSTCSAREGDGNELTKHCSRHFQTARHIGSRVADKGRGFQACATEGALWLRLQGSVSLSLCGRAV